ncbi:MAG: cytochrome ubiquinol oxidase subunit I [Pseudomonadota bacterium]
MDLDPVLLARIQFAANITFHILFPTITIALGWMLLFMRWRWLKTNQRPWLTAYRFWTKVFALTFALGVVSGITMSFQFGTNWPGFMEKVGNIAGPLLGFEVLTAFFLEATFLGVMLFGHGRVSERIHMLATFLVAFGTTMSAFWILVLNSWMQTPVGYEIIDGEFHVTSWLEIIFNPSFPWRFAHMLLASFLTMSFLVAGVSAWQVLRRKANPSSAVALRAALTLAALLIPVQIVVGDMHGLNTLQHQPQKIAAIEGVWETERGAPLLLFALPNEVERRNDLAIGIPKMASFILTHEWDGELQGLNEFENHPPVKPLFFGFRIMVAIGTLMLLVSWVGCWILRRHGWQPERAPRWLIASIAGMTFSGWVATVAGWYVTEIGRQPWIVQGLIKTADVASSTPAPYIALTLAGYPITYAALIVCYIGVLRYMAEKPSDTYDPAPTGGANVLGGAQLARKAGEA